MVRISRAQKCSAKYVCLDVCLAMMDDSSMKEIFGFMGNGSNVESPSEKFGKGPLCLPEENFGDDPD